MLAARLIGAFGVLPLALAAVGIYLVMAYAVAQRTHEIGVRIMPDAQVGDVLGLVVKQGMKLTFVGVALGVGRGLRVEADCGKFSTRDQTE